MNKTIISILCSLMMGSFNPSVVCATPPACTNPAEPCLTQIDAALMILKIVAKQNAYYQQFLEYLLSTYDPFRERELILMAHLAIMQLQDVNAELQELHQVLLYGSNCP